MLTLFALWAAAALAEDGSGKRCLQTIVSEGKTICLKTQQEIADLKIQLSLNQEVTENTERSMENSRRLAELLGDDSESESDEDASESEEERDESGECDGSGECDDVSASESSDSEEEASESESEDSFEDSPQAAFEDAQKNQMVMVVRADPEGHDAQDTVDAMVFTTESPEEAYDDLVAQSNKAWEAIDDDHELHFSYRITEPVPAQVRITDNQSLWSAFIMASYLDIDVPVLYAEMMTLSPTPTPTTGIPSVPPTPEPTATPTISGVTIDDVKYEVSYGLHDIVWDNKWKGDRIVIEDYGVTARMYTGNGHEGTRATKCFTEGNHLWRLQLYTNDDQRSSNVEWMTYGITNEGSYFDSYNQGNRSCGILSHSKTNYCASWGGLAAGDWKATPDQTTIELLLQCEKGLLSWRFFENEDTFITYKVPKCDDDKQCIYPWIEMHYADRHNSGTILGEPVTHVHNEWDDSDYEIVYGLKWDEDKMGSRIRCERDCDIARMYTGNGHQNARSTEGFKEGKHAWRLKVSSGNDNERNANAEWLVIGIVTEGDYFDTYNQANRSCGILTHSVTNYCNSWGYVAKGANNMRVPSRQTVFLMLDSDEGLLYYQFQGRSEPWVAMKVPKATLLYPWCHMHYGDSRSNYCEFLGQMFEFENVNHHFEQHQNNGR